jgi:hypothetical protein
VSPFLPEPHSKPPRHGLGLSMACCITFDRQLAVPVMIIVSLSAIFVSDPPSYVGGGGGGDFFFFFFFFQHDYKI